MTKYYNRVIIKNLDFKTAKKSLKVGQVITREEWTGIHFMYKNIYCVIMKNGQILVNPDISDFDKYEDWCIVEPTQTAIELINNYINSRD